MTDFHPSEADDQVFPELFTPEARAKRQAEQDQRLLDAYGDEYEVERVLMDDELRQWENNRGEPPNTKADK